MEKLQLQQQHKAIKKKYPDAVVLLRSGDNYFTAFNDTYILQQVCNIKESFPHSKFDQVLQQLVRSGHRVAVAEKL